MNWQTALAKLEAQGESYSLVTLIGVEGSAPRDSGTKMVVSESAIYGSIGGGNLEFTCTEKARELMARSINSQLVEYFPLSAKFNQCCSGAVSVMFETFVVRPPAVVIFGAGHVAKELSIVLTRLGYSLSIIDQRETQFSDFPTENILLIHSDNPVQELDSIDPNSYVLVMTHDHKLDFDLSSKALSEHQFKFFGLIGSQAKADKFKLRMKNNGLEPELVETLVSPIGLESVPGKLPMQVAISVAGQLIGLERNSTIRNTKTHSTATGSQGLSLKKTLRLKTFLTSV